MSRSSPPRIPRRYRKAGAILAPALALALLLPAAQAPGAEAEATVVFAAASTMAPMSELAALHERSGGRLPRLSFASSALLARQILNGAQPGLFLSANRKWMDALEDAGRLVDGSRRTLLTNRLSVIRRKRAERSVSLARPASLLEALENRPLVMGDPAHVPAGIHAREALRKLGLWEVLEGRLAFAANARAVTVRVARGEAPLGITYATEVQGESGIEEAVAIPAGAHSPIRYELALTGPRPGAEAFFEFLLGDTAAGVFRAHGFGTPSPVGK